MGSAAELGSVTSDPDGLKRDAALHLGLITLALAGGSALLGARFDQPLQTSLVALGLFAPIAATVVTRVTAFHPHPSFGLANVVTTVRAALSTRCTRRLVVPPFATTSQRLDSVPVGSNIQHLALTGRGPDADPCSPRAQPGR